MLAINLIIASILRARRDPLFTFADLEDGVVDRGNKSPRGHRRPLAALAWPLVGMGRGETIQDPGAAARRFS